MNENDKGCRKIVYTHIFCWFLFICYETLVSCSIGAKMGSIFDYVGHYSINIALFYCHAFWVLEHTITEKRKSYFKLIILISLEGVAYMLLKKIMYTVFLKFNIYHQQFMPSTGLFIMESIWRIIYFMAFSTAYLFSLSRLRQTKVILKLQKFQLSQKIEKDAIARELLVAENLYLKTQINPHFLFNALGFIHNQVYKISETAGETITALADITRYSLNQTSENGFVDLSTEIEHLENYITINRHRFAHQLKFEFKFGSNLKEIKIIPLLLITIVENVFKHAELINPKNPATITVESNNGNLLITVSNEKRINSGVTGTGIGMSNVRRRLDQHYKDNYQLIVSDTELTYNLKLSIKNK